MCWRQLVWIRHIVIEKLDSELMTISTKWDISSKIHCTVTDNASNIKGAVRTNAWNHFSCSCFAHTLNLIVHNLLSSLPEVQSLIESTFFRCNTKAMDKLTNAISTEHSTT